VAVHYLIVISMLPIFPSTTVTTLNDRVPYIPILLSEELSISNFQVQSVSGNKQDVALSIIKSHPNGGFSPFASKEIFEKLCASKLTRMLEFSPCVLSNPCNSTCINITDNDFVHSARENLFRTHQFP